MERKTGARNDGKAEKRRQISSKRLIPNESLRRHQDRTNAAPARDSGSEEFMAFAAAASLGPVAPRIGCPVQDVLPKSQPA
jgi:hypothetical protein